MEGAGLPEDESSQYNRFCSVFNALYTTFWPAFEHVGDPPTCRRGCLPKDESLRSPTNNLSRLIANFKPSDRQTPQMCPCLA